MSLRSRFRKNKIGEAVAIFRFVIPAVPLTSLFCYAPNISNFELAHTKITNYGKQVPKGFTNILKIGAGFVLFCFAAINNATELFAQQVMQIYDTAGTYTFIAPLCVTSVQVQTWGGGGGGGGGVSNPANDAGGGGGGGGYTLAAAVTVVPGNAYTVVVGAGGTAGSALAGGTGGTSSFNGTVTAAGGAGGGIYDNFFSSGNGAGGAGGTGGTYNGGSGANGDHPNCGGGGGGGAGSGGNGANGGGTSSCTGGAGGIGAQPGGAGGVGADQATGGTGNGPGGGGGGAFTANFISGDPESGGPGAAGQVIITYNDPLPTISSITGAGCSGSTITINGTNLSGATLATIGVTAIINLNISSTVITGKIAPGSISGIVSVTTPCGTATSSPFTVNPAGPPVNLGTITICPGGNYNFAGHTYSLAGTYSDTTSSTINGCDSITSVSIALGAITPQVVNQSICQGGSYTFNGNSYTTTTLNHADTLLGAGLNGCDSIVILNLTVNALPTPGITGPLSGCDSVSLTVIGGITYAWSGGNSINSAANTFTGSGNYSVTVTDNNSCSASATAAVVVSVAPTTAAVISSPLNYCGSLTSAGLGGNTPIVGTGIWTQSSGPGSTTFSNASIGSSISTASVYGTYIYSWTISAGTCVPSSASVTVNYSAAPIAGINGNTSGCGSVTLIATGGNSYSWNAGSSPNTASDTFNSSSIYAVTVTNSNGCTAADSANVNVAGPISLLALGIPASCNNNNGAAIAVVNAGTGPFNYQWSNNAITDTAANLAAGTYHVTVTGVLGCSASDSVTITSSSGVLLAITAVNTTCGNINGSAIGIVSSGSAPFTYVWSNSSNTDTISALAAGTYALTITDSTGCSGTASATIASSSADTVAITQDKTIMCSGDTAHICATSGFASYLWNIGDTTPCIASTLGYTYDVTATDNLGCSAVSNHDTVSIYPQLPVVLTVSDDTLHAYGGSNYQWYYADSLLPGQTSAVLVATQSGLYYVAETDSFGCVVLSTGQQLTISGIEPLGSIGSLRVYPNPLQDGNWNLKVAEALIGGTCEIYDAAGKLVFKSAIKNQQSAIELKVAQGIYLMRIYSKEGDYTFKLVKL